MKKYKRIMVTFLMAIFLMSTFIVDVNAVGCTSWARISKGSNYCSVNGCPGGFKRKQRQDKYRRKCLKNDKKQTVYYEYKYVTEYISCSCK